jgi:predicted nucleic acid-binding protein
VIILDTGVLIAAVDADDQHHEPCARLLRESDERFVVPAGVVVEVCWMLGRRVSVDAEAEFLRSVADGGLPVEALTGPDYQRARLLGCPAAPRRSLHARTRPAAKSMTTNQLLVSLR